MAGSLPAAVSSPKRAAAAVAITNDPLFQWAQLQYPALFGSSAPNVIANLPYYGKLFDVREFPGGAYLGISEGRVFGLGPFTNGQLTDFGVVQTYSTQVCSLVSCGGAGNSGGGNGTLNGCTTPAGEALRVGNRKSSVYTRKTFVPLAPLEEFTVDEVVEGSTIFEGQTAIKTSERTHGRWEGRPLDETMVSFVQVAENDLIRSLGSEHVGSSTTSHRVNNPSVLNSEFTLQQGQSIDQAYTTTTTLTWNKPLLSSTYLLVPTTETTSTRHTYETRETISVLGRSFDTCRYKKTTAGDKANLYIWYIYGKGLLARWEFRDSTGTVLIRNELKSATINGVSL